MFAPPATFCIPYSTSEKCSRQQFKSTDLVPFGSPCGLVALMMGLAGFALSGGVRSDSIVVFAAFLLLVET